MILYKYAFESSECLLLNGIVLYLLQHTSWPDHCLILLFGPDHKPPSPHAIYNNRLGEARRSLRSPKAS